MSQSSIAEVVDLEALVRPAVRAFPTYTPAKISVTESEPPHHLKLDMNESPYGPSPKTREALSRFDETNRYPTFAQDDLRAALGAYAGVSPDRMVPGAGLDDVLNNLMTLLVDDGDEVIISEPTFGVYRHLIAMRGGVTVDVPLGARPAFALDAEAILNAVTPRTKLIIICEPNNPTGHQFDPAVIERIVAEAPCLVAIDEAYAEFAGSGHQGLMDRYGNVCILRTLSKFAGLAGLRVGYGIFPEVLMGHLWRVTPAFCNISASSAAAAIASLDDLDFLHGLVARMNADRDTLANQLREIPGVTPFASSTNFLLVALPVDDAKPVVDHLAGRGVHVRYFGDPALGLRDCLRVSIGTPSDHEIFLAELETALASVGVAS